MRYSNGVEVTGRKDDFKMNAQIICKTFREEICQVSLKTMGECFGVSSAILSAFEHGKSSNFEFLSYYYDLIATSSYKRIFLELIFDSDDKNVQVIINKKLRNDIAKGFYQCVGIEKRVLEKERDTDGGTISFLINRMI